MKRLTKRMEDGSYIIDWESIFAKFGINTDEVNYKNILVTKLGQYEDICDDPDVLKRR